mmetsp:Transcript_19655/g.39552  ORF Transcript_19655/g.39552 Transcript_19655/m.39552 type:complete len:99 (+) Transcript_19655:295-591(+)
MQRPCTKRALQGNKTNRQSNQRLRGCKEAHLEVLQLSSLHGCTIQVAMFDFTHTLSPSFQQPFRNDVCLRASLFSKTNGGPDRSIGMQSILPPSTYYS